MSHFHSVSVLLDILLSIANIFGRFDVTGMQEFLRDYSYVDTSLLMPL